MNKKVKDLIAAQSLELDQTEFHHRLYSVYLGIVL